MAKTFKRMRDAFIAQGIPVVLGEYGLLGHTARANKVTTVLWDNGSFYDRGRLRWKDSGLLNLNGTTFKALKQGATKLVNGRDYTLSGNRLTLKAATLTRLAGSRSYGVNATLQAEFSRGVPWRIQVITQDTPVQSNTTGTAGSCRIPTQFRGDVLATLKAEYADGGNAGPTSWTPYQQFNTAFAPDYAKKAIRLTPAFLDAVIDVPRDQVGKHGDRHDVLR